MPLSPPKAKAPPREAKGAPREAKRAPSPAGELIDRRLDGRAEQLQAESVALAAEALLQLRAVGLGEGGLPEGRPREAHQLGRRVAEGLVEAEELHGEIGVEEGRIVRVDRERQARPVELSEGVA